MILINTSTEIEYMRKAGRTAAALLSHLSRFVKPGITTEFLDQKAHLWVMERGLVNAPLNYAPRNQPPFPKSICTSVNDVVCHGIPNETQVLNDGDIINIDVTPITNGFHGDTSKTFLVGSVSNERKKLVEVTKECLDLGIKQVKPGNTLGDIGHAIQKHAELNGFSVVKDFIGHGIGRLFHTDPIVLHYGKPNTGLKLIPGMIFTIEPMINSGSYQVKVLEDEWTAVTKDGSDSAQFEHTILVTNDGVEILTTL